MPDKDLVHAWLVKAARDLETARIVASYMPDYYDVIAFHCQQAIEKSLKGYLVWIDVEFKPVHDLGYLINLASTRDAEMDIWFEVVDEISRYAVQIRYPDTIIILTNDQVRDAIATADQIIEMVSRKIR